MGYSQVSFFAEMEIPTNLVYANNSNNDTLHCDEGALLGTFGLFVQALLALAAFMLLICEYFLLNIQNFVVTFYVIAIA